MLNTELKFYRHLISLHYRNTELPEDLINYLSERLQSKEFFQAVNGRELLAGSTEFWNFLQAQWKLFVQDKIAGTNNARVPFEHNDIKVYVDNLFIEGILNPIDRPGGVDMLPGWAKVGIKGFTEENQEDRLVLLVQKLDGILSRENLTYQQWLDLAPVLAEAKAVRYEAEGNLSGDLVARFDDVHKQLSNYFQDWVLHKYGSLSNLPYTKVPVMVHHIPRYLGYRGRKEGWQKLALVVIDGLAWDQWVLVRKHLTSDGRLRFQEGASFAWVPTMTSVSRQSIFAGEPPRYFKDSLFTTNKEEKLWQRFWVNEGYKVFNIKLEKGLGNGNSLEKLKPLLAKPKIKVLGLVVDKVDKMMHGQQLGTKGMHQDINLWMQDGYLKRLLDSLLENGFEVFITSDHGNVAAVGQGKLDQGVTVDSKGERFRIYQNPEFLKEAKEKTKSIEWPNVYGLPDDVHVLLAERETAYIAEGKSVVSHGGISIEEIIVPFIKVWKEEQS